MAELDAAALAAIAGRHVEHDTLGRLRGLCETCEEPWPCDAARLLAEVARLRAALTAAEDRYDALLAELP